MLVPDYLGRHDMNSCQHPSAETMTGDDMLLLQPPAGCKTEESTESRLAGGLQIAHRLVVKHTARSGPFSPTRVDKDQSGATDGPTPAAVVHTADLAGLSSSPSSCNNEYVTTYDQRVSQRSH
ncbi:hypothetical protein BDW66DRAFT_85434 [Aspergillus desertorum]